MSRDTTWLHCGDCVRLLRRAGAPGVRSAGEHFHCQLGARLCRPPLIKAEFILGSIADVSGCDVLGFLRCDVLGFLRCDVLRFLRCDVRGFSGACLGGSQSQGPNPASRCKCTSSRRSRILLAFRWLYALGYHTYSVDVAPPRPLELKAGCVYQACEVVPFHLVAASTCRTGRRRYCRCCMRARRGSWRQSTVSPRRASRSSGQCTTLPLSQLSLGAAARAGSAPSEA